MAHIPGPWSVDEEREEGGHYRVVDEQDVTVCRVYQQPFDTWQALDTAQLIAAAPNMLQAMRLAVAMLQGDNDIETAVDSAVVALNAAIAKVAASEE